MKRPGNIMIPLIIFGGVLLLAVGAIISLLLSQHQVIQRSVAKQQAFQIAEAGVNYYRWILAHDPDNYAGLDSDYVDSFGDTLGHFTVSITPPSSGSTSLTITATGWTERYPNTQRTLEVSYGKPSYAEFAFLTNSNVWFGSAETIHGRLHSNGGIRMDGTVDSLATSIKETYICGQEHGCDDEEKPGIWGTGQDPLLWDFPVADAIDFDAVTIDLETMATEAASSGVYLDSSNVYGYHIVFNSTGTFSVSKVTKLKNSVWGHNGTDWTYESNDIDKETAVQQYQNEPLPDNGIIFVDDQTWVSGQVNGRVTVAAASLPEGTTGDSFDIIIHDDISYYPDRTSGAVLGLIAQEDILVPLYSPTDLTIDAAMMAQNGHVIRYYYYPPYYPADTIKTTIETYGTIVTNTIWTWTWVDAQSTVVSGYQNTNTMYDANLLYAPPPYWPTKDEYTFISWSEV